MKKAAILLIVLTAFTAAWASAATQFVPQQYRTIQAAIDASTDGDTVIVAAGTYTGDGNRDIEFRGKAITLRSTDPNDPAIVAATIIDCNGTREDYHRGFYFVNDEDLRSLLAGLTIENGCTDYGGAIYCRGSSPTISKCNITSNRANFSGGGIHCYWDSNPMIVGCTISSNTAGRGGGVHCSDSNPHIGNCVITKNRTPTCESGGGVFICNSDLAMTNCVISNNEGGGFCAASGYENYPSLTNCTICGNVSNSGAGVSGCSTVTNCIIWGNSPEQIAEYWRSPAPSVSYSDVQGGYPGQGNIEQSPEFAFPADYHLVPGSPCIDAGTNAPAGGLPAADIEGHRRIVDGNEDGIAVADMGAYEHLPARSAIALSASSLKFCHTLGKQPPGAETLSIRNCGSGVLRWRVVEDCNWLEVCPRHGTCTDNLARITLTVAPAVLPKGLHTCSLTVLDGTAVNSPVLIAINLQVVQNLCVPDQFSTIQAAIDAACDGDEVIVAPGTYTGEGNRDIKFRGKAITVRSVDPNNPDTVAATIIDCNGSKHEPHRGFEFWNGEDADSVLAGLTITGGYRSSDRGGAICCAGSGPTISKCVITKNTPGALWCWHGSPVIDGCTISGNAQGPGISADGCMLTVANCVISDNSTESRGGGIECQGCDASIINCKIEGNWARWSGGAVSCIGGCGGYGKLRMTNCTITENIAYRGGGIYVCLQYVAIITNCTIVGNSASDEGGGIFTYGALERSTSAISNCIVRNNYPRQIVQSSWRSVPISYNNIQGGWEGQGNIDSDPCFLEPGSWGHADDANLVVCPNDPNAIWVDGDYHLLAGSPCINSGDPNYVVSVEETDIDGQPRVFDGRIDMGADEFVPRVQCEMEFRPRALNLRSKGKYVKAHLLLPEGFAADEVDTDSPAVIEPLGIESERIKVVGGEQNRVEVSAVFARKAFCSQGDFDGSVSVEGLLKNGQTFYGTDQVKIIDRTSGQIAALARCWLRSDCRPPDWCDGLDINGDSVVNFADFAGLNTCCIEAGVQ